MTYALIIFGFWIIAGAIVTAATKDPEQDGWVWMVLLWPIQLWSQWR